MPFRLATKKPSLARYLKALIFGPYGSGKTTFVSTAQADPRTSPVLVLSFEGGESSISGENVEILRIDSWKKYNTVLEDLQSGDHPFKSVVIDSISETHIFSLFEILEAEAGNRKNADLIEIGDYGIASVQLRRLIRNFRDLDLHVLLTALAKQDTEPREGIVTKPALSGRLADELPGIVDVVGYLSEAQLEGSPDTVRALILKGYPKIRSKIRLPRELVADVPNELIDPTVSDLLDALHFPAVE